MDRNLLMARSLAQRAAQAGGRAYFVGGYVRDAVLGRENKDIDIEVHGLTPAQLEGILGELGECTQMGASFGIYGLKHYDLDIAMPRRETKSGRGHRDFDVYVEPFLGTRRAAQRRDFTVNAMMQDVLTGEIIDEFGGLGDLEDGVLRHVCDASFVEDPLRALRGAQFASRFGFRVAPETIRLCAGMDLTALASERIMGEMVKALLKAPKPSVFFDVLREMDQLDSWFAQVRALIGVMQEPRFHPEGDVYTHTMLVLDQAARLRGGAAYPLGLMMAALCHDFGKPDTTKTIDGRIRSLGHEEAGVELADAFVARLSTEVRLIRYVRNMVKLHMRPNALYYMQSGEKAYMKLFDEAVEPADLLLLAKADHCGRTGREHDYGEIEEKLGGMLSLYRARMSAPGVTGADLIAAGMQPGREMGDALAYAHKLQLGGAKKEEALAGTLAHMRERKKG